MINGYDFDGTIYNGDSSVDFYFYCLKRNPKIIKYIFIQIFGIILYFLGIKKKEYMKEKFFSILKSIDNVDEYVKDFWAINYKKIKPWYLKQKKKTDVIISASPEFLLKPLEEKLGVKVIATKVNKKTGKFESKNCHDYEKIKRYEEVYKNKKLNSFYSDSLKADKPMLEYAKEAYLVEGDKVSKIEEEIKVKDNILTKIFLIGFFIVFAYVFINVIFNNASPLPKCNTWQSILALVLYSAFVFGIYKLLFKIKIPKVVRIIIFILFFGLQIAFAYIFAVKPSWDFGAVYNAAVDHVSGVLKLYDNNYFYRCDNNIGIALLFIVYYRVLDFLHIGNYPIMSVILNIIMIDLSIWYLRKIVKRVFNEKVAAVCTILMLLFTPFITYVPIFYTDTMSMPFAIMGLYYFIKLIDSNNTKKIIKNALLCGIAIGIGSFIKFTAIILFVAIIIFEIVNIKRFKLKKVLLVTLCIGLPILLFNGIIKLYTRVNFDSKVFKKESMPFTHYIMMGANGLGGYNYSDVEYTLSFDKKSEQKKANIKEFKRRINNLYKENKLVKFYTDKLTFVWGDGTLFAPEKLHREPVYDYSFKSYIIIDAKNESKSEPYLKISQAEWLFMLFSILLGIIFRNELTQKQKDIQVICLITVFGVLLFFMFWESRSRYILNMAPIIMLSSFVGLQAVANRIGRGIKHEEKK